nr:hypothetical protein [Sicyoidochytrium minutum DNA virus]
MNDDSDAESVSVSIPEQTSDVAREWLRNHTKFFDEDDTLEATSKIHDAFLMGVYVICLPKRLENVKSFCRSLGIKPRILIAIDKNTLNFQELVRLNLVTNKFATERNRGRIACHMSHIAALLHALEANPDAKANHFAFVLEDDISLDGESPSSASNRVYKFMSQVKRIDGKKKPKLAFVGYCYESKEVMIRGAVAREVLKMNQPKCRHAYGANPGAIHMLIDRTLPQWFNGDEIYSSLIFYGALDAYGMERPAVWQDRASLGTNLGNDSLELPLFAEPFSRDTQAETEDESDENKGAWVVPTFATLGALLLIGLIVTGIVIARKRGKKSKQ